MYGGECLYSNGYIFSCSHLIFCAYLGNDSVLLLLHLSFITITITLHNIFYLIFPQPLKAKPGNT